MDMLAAIYDKALERNEKWKPVIVKELPDPFHLQERATLGSYSIALQESRIRLLKKSALLRLGEHARETPSTIARDYLKLSYKRSPKITHNQAVVIQDTLAPMPLYSDPGEFEHGFYIDIRATYWSVMNIAGWNVDYYPGKWMSAGRPPHDFPFPNHKQARSCLVSVARPGVITFYEPVGKFPQMKVGSPVINLSISKLISDLMNCIALEAVELGAIYANTDGYIVPNERKAANVLQMIFDWGLIPRIKAEGRGAVRDIGAYKVGDIESIPFRLTKSKNEVRKINAPREKKWIMSRFSRLSAMSKVLTS